MTRNTILSRFAVVASIAWFVLWACAPMSRNPPPTPMPEAASGEFAVGINGGATVDSYWRCEDAQCEEGHEEQYTAPLGNLQGSARIAAGSDKHNEAGLLFQLGYISMLSGGGYYRHSLVHNDTISFGMQVDLGWLWAGYRLPVAYRVSDSFWLTTMPGVQAGFDFSMAPSRMAVLPVGFSWQFNKKARFDTEIGTHLVIDGDLYDYAAYGSMGISIASIADDSPRYRWFR